MVFDRQRSTFIEDRYEDIKLDENNTIGSGISALLRIKDITICLIYIKCRSTFFWKIAKPHSDNLWLLVKWNVGFADTSGEICIEPVFEEAMTFSCGFAAVKRDGMGIYRLYSRRS